RVAFLRPVVACAAGHEASHRVAEERDLIDLDRPLPHHLLEQFGEATTVVGDVEPAVVADIQRRVAELLAKPGTVAAPSQRLAAADRQPPRLLRLAQPVDEEGEPCRRFWEGPGKGSAIRR